MICDGIGYVHDGGSVIFSCLEKENNIKVTKKNFAKYYSKYVTTFKLYRNYSDIESYNYGKFQKFKRVDKDNFEWVKDPKDLSELAEAITNFVNSTDGKKNKHWFDTSWDMRKLTKESRY